MLTRREYLKLSTLAAASTAFAQTPADHALTIGPHSFEYRSNRFIKTIAYNQQVPGPLLRFREGQPVTVDVTNSTANEEVVHWHGLQLPSEIDGTMEEGTPMIAVGATKRLSFLPKPSGLRWYHTHTFAGADMKRAQYTAQHGPLLVEPRSNPARYDKEFVLMLHDWQGQFLPSDDGSLMPQYEVSTINGKALGFGEPLRVNTGDRALFHIINSSPTETHWLSLAGHSFQVIALDGNNVPTQHIVSQLRLAPAERISAIVEMNRPGAWVLGEIRKHIQAAGMGIVIEYANNSGKPQWQQPDSLAWNYLDFASKKAALAPSEILNLVLSFKSKFRGHGAPEEWLINGKPYPDNNFITLQRDRRYRLVFNNESADDHPIHLHRHLFEIRRIAKTETSGIVKDVVLVPAKEAVEIEFVADNPGATLLHCHQQDHMDNGFMTLLRYV